MDYIIKGFKRAKMSEKTRKEELEELKRKVEVQERNISYQTPSIVKFQDYDRDGLIDICDDDIEPLALPCKGPCIPNPNAIVPDWKNNTVEGPMLNTKKCLYQSTMVTRYSNTAPPHIIRQGDEKRIQEYLKGRFDEYVEEVIDNLLTFYVKENTPETVEKLKEAVRYEKYDLAPHPGSRLKLLYSFPFDVVFNLNPAPPDDEDEEDEDEPGTMVIQYEADRVGISLIRVTKALGLYNRFHVVGQQLGEGSLTYVDTGGVFNLEDYGGGYFGSGGVLNELGTSLEVFLNSKGYQMMGVGARGFFDDWFKERITKLELKLHNYKLKNMKIWTVSCGQKPIFFNKKTCGQLNRNEAWKDPTAVAYFANLFAMDQDINARVAIPWKEISRSTPIRKWQ